MIERQAFHRRTRDLYFIVPRQICALNILYACRIKKMCYSSTSLHLEFTCKPELVAQLTEDQPEFIQWKTCVSHLNFNANEFTCKGLHI